MNPKYPLLPIQRPRRNRSSETIRGLIRETELSPSHLISPLFLVEGKNQKQPIASMPEIYRFSIDMALREIAELTHLGIQTINIFCDIPEHLKDPKGSLATSSSVLFVRAVHAIKEQYPHLCVIVDIALDPFTDHGHDGILNTRGDVDNDATLPILAEMSLRAAEAGADFVSPSDMMDGRVKYIRSVLDQEGFTQVGILSYTAKYASALYGPFREALHSAPRFGDKRSYQMDPSNQREAIREALLDADEGADLLLIKPALYYLDIISKIREVTTLPIGAYHVSGEYSMVMGAAAQGWLDPDRTFKEALISIKRAGADFIITYAAKRIASQLFSYNP